jgi:hypothetical protein
MGWEATLGALCARFNMNVEPPVDSDASALDAPISSANSTVL